MISTITKKRNSTRKVIALFLLFTLLNQLFAPTVAYALTAGPTAPEATSFEPIDTTDMVNALTGNFTYSLPLLEVPGPEGSYPLSLSYHAGIQPNEEASWVGLGWTLNPGAITRNVNGFADDFSDVTQSKRDYWVGGSRSTFGITVGLPSNVTFGLEFSNDTYQGFGVGASIGYDFSIFGQTIGARGKIGIDAYGQGYANASLGKGLASSGAIGLGLGANISLSTNFKSIRAEARIGVSAPLLDASISSSGGSPSLSVGGANISVYNANSGKIQTKSSGFSFGIPIGFFNVGISYSYTRYWSDETANINTNGALYFPQQLTDQTYFTTRTYDVYRLQDPKNYNIVDYPDPDKLQGGTFPDYDNYSVTAQGLNGNIRPYIYQSVLYSQNQADIIQTSGAPANGMNTTPGVQFRFINDFSNAYRQAPTNMSGLAFQFDSPVYGNNDGNYGYNPSTNQLAGSKHIAWYSNSQINSGYAKGNGFIDVPANNGGFIRMGNAGALTNSKGAEQVGGFTITNESGVSYHYALPVYEYNEVTYTALQNDSQSTTDVKIEPYAYTWYLTAITGPDYVDKNNDGLANDGDWGYYMTFDYGKWTSSFNWRNPAQGAHTEIDPNYKSYSKGTKELYYLDAIKSRTHTALFVKELRADGKSVSIGGFDANSVSTLGLNYILLMKNDQFSSSVNAIRQAGTTHTVGPMDQNLIDNYDINALNENINQKCLRKILLNHDYSLTPGVPNSFQNPNGSNTTGLGKYTLQSIDFQGSGGASLSPLTTFQYDLDPTDPANQDFIDVVTVSGLNGSIRTATAGKFKAGDILTFQSAGVSYYCTLLSALDSKNFNVLFLNTAPAGALSSLSAAHTKNPPYNNDAHDIWAMYKSDYVPITNNENLSRLTSKLSNLNVDVWSLRNIQTSVGANFRVNYEGDTYQRSILNKNKSMIFNGGVINASAKTITFTLSNPQNIDLNSIYPPGGKLDAMFLFDRAIQVGVSVLHDKKAMSLSQYKPAIVNSLTGNTIQIAVDPQFFTDLNTSTNGTVNSSSILTGNVQFVNYNSNPGGGIRVRDLVVDDLNGTVKKTSYNYNLLNFTSGSNSNKISSGITSYEPVLLDNDNISSFLSSTLPADTTAIKSYHRLLYKDINEVIAIAREAPAPGVMYEYVTVADSVLLTNGTIVPVPGQTAYQYRVFNSGMLGIKQFQYDKNTSTHLYLKNLSIKDYTSQIGNLVRTIIYDAGWNKLSETINRYSNDATVNNSFDSQVQNYEPALSAYNNQGVIQERYADGRSFRGPNNVWTYELTMSGRDQYPIIGTGVTMIDYKNGTKMSSSNLEFDFYSGMVTKTLNVDSYGNRFMTQVTPAYRKYPAMGVKVLDYNNSVPHKNMLTQEAASYTFSVDLSNAPIGLVAANVQTWANDTPVLDPDGNVTTAGQSNIYRMQSSYKWLPAGTSANNITPVASFIDFFATGGSANPAWKKTAQITQYNVFSNALEATDINNNYAATRMGYNTTRVLVTASPSRFNEVAYTGAEDALLSNGNFSSNITKGTGTIVTDSTLAHTGVKTLMVPAQGSGYTYTVPLSQLGPISKDYKASVWVKPAAGGLVGQAALYYQVAGGGLVSPGQTYTKVAKGWYLLQINIPANAITGSGNLVIGCNNGTSNALYFDDFRFQPASSVSSAYVYDNQTGEVSYVLDNNNLFVRYQYDAIGRLVRIYKEVLGKSLTPISQAIAYNQAKAKYSNAPLSRTFNNQNCGAGFAIPYVFSVPEGTYFSTVSKQDANNQALSYIAANGQNAANTNGQCAVALTLTNAVNIAGFQARVTDIATSVVTYYDFTATSGTIPFGLAPGTYTITVNPVNVGVNHTFSCTGKATQSNVPGATFTNVIFTSGTSGITVSIQ
jgi:hypothetical protein